MSRSIDELVEAIQSHEAELNRTADEADRQGSAPATLVGTSCVLLKCPWSRLRPRQVATI